MRGSGQRPTWTLVGEASDEDEERLDQLRYRLDVMINADPADLRRN